MFGWGGRGRRVREWAGLAQATVRRPGRAAARRDSGFRRGAAAGAALPGQPVAQQVEAEVGFVRDVDFARFDVQPRGVALAAVAAAEHREARHAGGHVELDVQARLADAAPVGGVLPQGPGQFADDAEKSAIQRDEAFDQHVEFVRQRGARDPLGQVVQQGL